MRRERRWDPCVAHRGDDVDGFLDQYFAQPDRSAFLVAGAGFDPRSCAVAGRLTESDANVRALLIRERRPNPAQVQLDQAEANMQALLAMIPKQRVEQVEIFGPDGAVVGGRNIINVLRRQDFGKVTDLIVDISALSAGTFFHWFATSLRVLGVVGSPRTCTSLLFMIRAWTLRSGP